MLTGFGADAAETLGVPLEIAVEFADEDGDEEEEDEEDEDGERDDDNEAESTTIRRPIYSMAFVE